MIRSVCAVFHFWVSILVVEMGLITFPVPLYKLIIFAWSAVRLGNPMNAGNILFMHSYGS